VFSLYDGLYRRTGALKLNESNVYSMIMVSTAGLCRVKEQLKENGKKMIRKKQQPACFSIELYV